MRLVLMKKLILAILDSGVDNKYLENMKENNILQCNNYTDEVEYDLNGHGTCTFNYIKKYNEHVKIKIYKLLNKFGKAKLDMFEKVLHDILKQKVDVVCMPLSFRNLDYKDKQIRKINSLLKKISIRGTKIICSYENGKEFSFPAENDYVMGIQGAFLDDIRDYWYNGKDMVTNILPECVKTIGDRRCFFSGNSKACVLAVVIILDIMEKNDYSQLDYELKEKAKKDIWNYCDINRKVESLLNYDIQVEKNSIYNKIKSKCNVILKRHVRTHNITVKQVNKEYYDLIDHLEEILSEIEKVFEIKIYEENIFAYDLLTIDSITSAVYRWIQNYEKNK